jgi:aspartyl-tRNA(Asn)/glutamyl-tRNA(Gln) amidotransferase subunit A
MHKLSAIELRNKFIKGEISATQIVQHFLNRIEKYNQQTGAFLVVFNEKALAKAKELDEKKAAGKPMGKLAAIPIAIKDNIHIKGEFSTCGSKFLTNFRAPFNSTVVNLILIEECIILRKNKN